MLGVLQELKLNWKTVMATVIGFLGSAFGTVGGVGGGGIFVPMLTLVVGFDTKSAAALSKCMLTLSLHTYPFCRKKKWSTIATTRFICKGILQCIYLQEQSTFDS